MAWLLYFLAAVALFVGTAVVWRFFTLRSQGYPVVVRRLPNSDGRHWRHGILKYSGHSARFYKLRSLRPASDVVLTRLGTAIVSRREITPRESAFLEDNVHVVEVVHRKTHWEIALDSAGDTALVAWLESAPSERRIPRR